MHAASPYIRRHTYSLIACVTILFCTVPSGLEAATKTWLGLTNNWNTTSNWNTGTLPNSADIAVFDSSGFSGSFAVDLTATGNVQRFMTINSSPSTWTFSGSAINAVGGSAIWPGEELNVFISTGGARTILNNNLNLTGTPGTSFTVATGNAGAQLTINGLITGINRGVVFENTIASGTNFIAINGANTYTGATVLRAGTIYVNTDSLSGVAGAFGNATGAVGLATGLNPSFYNTTQRNLTLLIATSGVTIGRDFTVTNANAGATVGTTVGSNITSGTATYSGNFALSRDMNVGAASGGTTVFSGVISGAGFGLTKTNVSILGDNILINTGTVSLTGINTYTGTTTISTGTLNLNTTGGNAISAGAGDVTVNSGGTLSLSQSDQIGDNVNLVVSGGTVSLGTNSDTVNNVTMTAGSITGSGNITSGTGSFTTNASGSTATISSGIAMGGDTTFTIAEGAAATDLNVTGVVSGANNFIKAGAGLMAVGGTNTYTGTTTVRNGTLQLNANAPSGADGTLGNATSAVQLADAGSNTTDNIALVAGVGGLSIGRDIVVNTNNSSGTTTIGGTHTSGTSTFSGGITLNQSALLTAASGGTDTFSGVISGAGGITKTGAGTVILNNTNTYNGATTVRNGTLQLDSNGALGSAVSAVALGDASSAASDNISLVVGTGGVVVARDITVNNNNSSGTTTLGGNHTSGTGTFSGNIALSRNVTLTAATGGTDVFSGVISGGFGVIKSGAGTVSLTGINTYTGTTSVNAGTLDLNTTGGNAIAAGAGTVTVNNATLSLSQSNQIGDNVNVSVQNSGTFSMGTNDETIGNLTIGSSSITGSGTLTTSTGSITENGGSVSTISANLGLTGPTTVTINDSGLTLSGVVSGTGSLLQVGSANFSPLTLSGNNTFVGDTTVRRGSLQLNSNNALGNAANTLFVTDASSTGSDYAQIYSSINGTNIANNMVVGNNSGIAEIGSYLSSGQSMTYSGSVTLNKTLTTLFAGDDSTTIFSNVLSGTGNVRIDGFGSNGNGMVQFSGTSANTYTGTTQVMNLATLQLNKTGVNAIASGAGDITVGEGATVQLLQSNQIGDNVNVNLLGNTNSEGGDGPATLALGSNSDTVANIVMNDGAITGTGTITSSTGSIEVTGGSDPSVISANLNLGSSTTINTSGQSLNVSGVVSGTNLVKDGSETVTLSGINTYTGTTTVNNGTLNLNTTGGNSIAAGAGPVTVNTGGTLALAQANQIGDNVNLILNGGTLSLSGNETLGTLSLTENSTIDFGGGAAVLTFSGLGTFTAGKTLTIVNWSGSGLGGGTDQLQFLDTSGLTPSILSQIYFQYNNAPDWGPATTVIGLSPGEVVPSPEVGTVMSGILMLAVGGYAEYRRRRRQ